MQAAGHRAGRRRATQEAGHREVVRRAMQEAGHQAGRHRAMQVDAHRVAMQEEAARKAAADLRAVAGAAGRRISAAER
jgi:hypothetical protein